MRLNVCCSLMWWMKRRRIELFRSFLTNICRRFNRCCCWQLSHRLRSDSSWCCVWSCSRNGWHCCCCRLRWFLWEIFERCSLLRNWCTALSEVWTTVVVVVCWVLVVIPLDELFKTLVVCVSNLVTFCWSVVVDVDKGGILFECVVVVVPLIELLRIPVLTGKSFASWKGFVVPLDDVFKILVDVLSGEISLCSVGWDW